MLMTELPEHSVSAQDSFPEELSNMQRSSPRKKIRRII